tara:strand:- start:258 stop:1223 length:966 start_codon:yes stop_codon:yes gene_type:complete
MGASNPQFVGIWEDYFNRFFKSLEHPERIKKIAMLGSRGRDQHDSRIIIDIFKKHLNTLEISDANSLIVEHYDIDVDEGAKYWDINGSWANIGDYDLVLGIRVSPFSKNAEHFSKEISGLLERNSIVVFDFFLGGPTIIPAMLPNYKRKSLINFLNLDIKNLDFPEAIFSFDDIINRKKRSYTYSDFHILPKFDKLNLKFRNQIKVIAGYDIKKVTFALKNKTDLLTDELLSKYNIAVSLSENESWFYDIYNWSCQIKQSHLISIEDNPTIAALQVLFGGAMTRTSTDDVFWFTPASPFCRAEAHQLPAKRFYMINRLVKK